MTLDEREMNAGQAREAPGLDAEGNKVQGTTVHSAGEPTRGADGGKPDREGAKSPGHDAVLAAFDDADEQHLVDDASLAQLEQNDLGNGRRLQARFGPDMVFVAERGWGVWDGARWAFEGGDARAMMRAHDTAQRIFQEADTLPRYDEPEPPLRTKDHADWKAHKKQIEGPRTALYFHALASGNQGKATAMLSSAAPYLRRSPDDFDADPWVMSVQNGTLIFGRRDGTVELKAPDRDDLITHMAGVHYNPDAPTDRWAEFVKEVLPDDEVRAFVQRWLGYALTGDTSEQKIAQFEGQGANGKSTLLEVVDAIMGTYSVTTPIETFLHQDRGKNGSGPSPDIARLPGARLVRTSEPEPGSRLSESMVKQWTGGEAMIARELNKPFFEFRPVGKLTLSVNIRPVIVGKDHGIKRRIMVVPFTQKFPPGKGANRGETLVDELLREREGVLNWLLEGFAMWWRDGLNPPAAVYAATDAYFAEMDPVGAFIGTWCEKAPDNATADQVKEIYSVPATELFHAYERWCAQNNEDAKKQTAFGRRLGDMGIKAQARSGLTYRVGVRLRDEWAGGGNGGGAGGFGGGVPDPVEPMEGVL